MPKNGDLQIWWVPQMPMKAFEAPVMTLHEAGLLLDTLAEYDKFQFENNVKPDYSNAGGLNIYEDGEWIDWYSDSEGEYWTDFDEYREFIEEKDEDHQRLEET